MITDQDLEDLKILKILQESGDLADYKDLKRELNHSIERLHSISRELRSLTGGFMEELDRIREIQGREEEIVSQILEKVGMKKV
jgi:hypothetical protein